MTRLSYNCNHCEENNNKMDSNVFVDSTSKTSLHVAIDEDDIERVKNLINSGVDVNITFENGTTPLVLAIGNKRNEIVKYLIDEGADVNGVCDHKTPLILAIEIHGNEMFHNRLRLILKSMNRNLPTDFCNKSKEIIKYLIDKDADVNIFYENESPLCLAITNNSGVEIVRHLIDKGADVNLVCKNKTPLLLAIEESRDDIAKYLIDRGADVNSISNNLTLLHLDIERRGDEIAKYLVDKGADVNRVCEGKSPLYLAIYHRATELAKYLIDRDADINFISNNLTLLHLAIERRGDQIAKYLVDKGVDVNRVCEDKSPLYLAIYHRATELAKYLIDRDADINFISNNLTLLHLAVERRCDEIAKYLVDKGVDVNRVCEDKSPLYLAIYYHATKLAKYFINNGADVNGNFNGKRLLQVALERNNRDYAKYLLISGFDVNTKDEHENVVADYFITSNRSTIATDTVKQHIVKLIAANFYMCQKNKMAVADKKYDSLRHSCVKEVKLMKQNSLTRSALTYFDLLRKPLHKSALKLKFLFKNNPEVKCISFDSNILSQITSYSEIIQYRFDRALKRAELLVEVDDFVVDISQDLLLDPEVVREVFQYLTNRDLKLLCNSA